MRQQRGQFLGGDFERGNAVQLRLQRREPSLLTAAVSMQLAYSSPIFCSLAVRVGDAQKPLRESASGAAGSAHTAR
jgi:hypothetical protein